MARDVQQERLLVYYFSEVGSGGHCLDEVDFVPAAPNHGFDCLFLLLKVQLGNLLFTQRSFQEEGRGVQKPYVHPGRVLHLLHLQLMAKLLVLVKKLLAVANVNLQSFVIRI